MKIVDVSFFYDEHLETAEQLLEQHYTTVGWAEALQRQGMDIVVIKRFSKDGSFQRNGVPYHFVADSFGGRIKFWQLPFKLVRKIIRQKPDVVHLHNFSLSLQVLLLRFFLAGKTAMVIQHHGGPLPKGKMKRFHDFFNRVANGFFFTTIAQGKEWFLNKRSHDKIMPVMEGSTFFNFKERAAECLAFPSRGEARKQTGMTGAPVFLWVGRLDENKDPLTVLSGFEILCQEYRNARLYLLYSDDKLIDQVREKIRYSESLQESVRLLGKIPHEEIQCYYNSADYFVLGSHYEGSGYALSEALRCGCVPVITDIPSFKMMTNEGQLGALWKPGDVHSFINAAQIALRKPLKQEADACIRFFKEKLSFDAIAEAAIQQYDKLRHSRM